MRVMVIVKASKESEDGILPDTELLTRMGKYNEQLTPEPSQGALNRQPYRLRRQAARLQVRASRQPNLPAAPFPRHYSARRPGHRY